MFRGHADPSGKPGWARLFLRDQDEPVCGTDRRRTSHAELGQPILRPAPDGVSRTRRRLRDSQKPAHCQQRGRALGDDGGPAESPGGDKVKSAPPLWCAADDLGSRGLHRDTSFQPQHTNGPEEERRTMSLGFDKEKRWGFPTHGEHEPGNPTPRTEVNHGGRGGGCPCALDRLGEGVGVLQLRIDRAGTKEPEVTRLGQEAAKGGSSMAARKCGHSIFLDNACSGRRRDDDEAVRLFSL